MSFIWGIVGKNKFIPHYKNELHSLLYKMSFSYSKRISIFLFPVLCVFRRLDQVLCLSVVGTVIGSNIVSVRRSSIKVLLCCLYVVLS